MHPNHAAVTMFLKAQEARDPVRLSNSLHESSTLVDPLVGELKGWRVFAWWQMLWRFRNHAITIVEGEGTPTKGHAHWKVGYTHPSTRRAMLTDTTSEIEFRENKIFVQNDSYSLYKWCRQALGAQGLLLGWLPPIQAQLREAALERLENFIDSNGLHEDNYLLGEVKRKKRGIPELEDISFARSHDNLGQED
jgi:hypothetical protein